MCGVRGSTGSLSDFEGQPVVVHFFASWAVIDRSDLPAYAAAHERADGRFAVLGISHDHSESAWREFVGRSAMPYATAFQPNQEVFDEIGGVGMPTTVFLSAEGEIVDTWTGFISAERLFSLISEHLNVDL